MQDPTANDAATQVADPLREQLAVPLCQVPRLLGVGKSKAHELVKDGVLESRKLGRSRLVTTRSIRALLYGEAA